MDKNINISGNQAIIIDVKDINNMLIKADSINNTNICIKGGNVYPSSKLGDTVINIYNNKRNGLYLDYLKMSQYIRYDNKIVITTGDNFNGSILIKTLDK